MTARVTVAVHHDDGGTTVWTAEFLVQEWHDTVGILLIHGDNWHRQVHPPAPDGDDTGPCTGCGQHIDRTQPHVTHARHVEITGPDHTRVLDARALAQYHPDCEPGEPT